MEATRRLRIYKPKRAISALPTVDPPMLQRSSSPISLGSRSPRAIHIDRLLDPAYSSSSYASSSAYVDPTGELHDPDYRQFPISKPTRRTSNYTPSRPKWETFDEEEDIDVQQFSPARRTTSFSSYQHSRPVYAYTYTPTYVASHSYDSGDTELDEEEDDAFGSTTKPHTVSRIISRTKELTRKRRSLDGASRRSTDSSPNSPYFTPSSLPDTPASDDRRPLSRTLSRHSEPERTTSFTPLYSTSTSTHHRHSRSHAYAHAQHEPTPAYTPSADAEREPSWTPTCAQALRRQWQAVSLSVRFGVFRAQRKWKSRLAMR
ncbi:hypothetical protein H0H92_006166 [Tricholoma furcatifolium]|nr:hypothetical protein H0H92_006166 [Tricholoma furcatifolium]